MNKVILMGRLTADPETKYTQSNVAVTRFNLAVNRIGKQQEGQPTADFFNIVAWRQTAEFVGKHFQKGQQVLVEGYLRNNNWTDQQGQKRYSTEIHIDHAYFAEGRKNGTETQTDTPQRENTITEANRGQSSEGDGFYQLDELESDLPF